MRPHATDPLFAWGELADRPSLVTIRDFLGTVLDQPLLDGLRSARGNVRDDYPVTRLWHVLSLTILLRLTSVTTCLAELHCNPALCRVIGITAVDQIPNGWNLTRFLDVLGREPHLSAFRDVLDHVVRVSEQVDAIDALLSNALNAHLARLSLQQN